MHLYLQLLRRLRQENQEVEVQRAKIAPLHFSMGDKVRLCLKKEKKRIEE